MESGEYTDEIRGGRVWDRRLISAGREAEKREKLKEKESFKI